MVHRMIPKPGDAACTILVPETFHEQTDDELTKAEIKQMEADDQAIQTIILGLLEDIYAAVDTNQNGNGNVVAAWAEGNANGSNAADLNKIEEVNANCILIANLQITSTLKFPNVPNTSIKLMLFLFSLEGTAWIWLENEPPRSIFTWDDLVSKFINQFFPPSKTTNLRNEITNFQQRFDEYFSEAWDIFKDLLRACPHHGFSELHQLDTLQ
nr:reverse transcriptase domain-containing protein [Tanacetum cinerariifolium]